MARLSEKYIAGFLDSDGCVSAVWRDPVRNNPNPEQKRLYLSLEFTQKTSQDEVLHRIQERIGGKITSQKDGYASCLRIFGKQAVMVLNRIQKHLVIKRRYIGVLLEMEGKIHNVEEAKRFLKEQRKIQTYPLPNYPTRAWMAGYIDGDGCFHAVMNHGRDQVVVKLEIACCDYDDEGLRLIQKVFGGRLRPMNGREWLHKLTIDLVPSKAKKLINYIRSHLIIKKEQALFVLGCAEMGNYRDGKNIKSALKQLKSQPHRLSEPRLDAAHFLKGIERITFDREIHRAAFEKSGCKVCGGKKHCCQGLCKKCYDRQRNQVKR